MTRDEVVLKPCPFCGGAARLMDMTKRAARLGYQYVECRPCGVDAGSVTAWNTRASPSASADRGGLREKVADLIRDAESDIYWACEKGYDFDSTELVDAILALVSPALQQKGEET